MIDYYLFKKCKNYKIQVPSTVYLKSARRSIPKAPVLSLNGSTVIIAAAELLAYN